MTARLVVRHALRRAAGGRGTLQRQCAGAARARAKNLRARRGGIDRMQAHFGDAFSINSEKVYRQE